MILQPFCKVVTALLRVQEILFINKNAGILNCAADKIFQVWAVPCMHGKLTPTSCHTNIVFVI